MVEIQTIKQMDLKMLSKIQVNKLVLFSTLLQNDPDYYNHHVTIAILVGKTEIE